MHSLTGTQCPILSARVRLKCWKHSRIWLSWAVRQAGEGRCVSSGHRGSRVQFFRALDGHLKQLYGSSPRSMYTCTRKQVCVMSLPPTDLSLFVHVHFQMLLWKAADYQCPLDVSISEYGREIKDDIICPSIDKANWSCHRVKLSCTIYCFCSTGVVCRNSSIKKEDETEDEEQHNDHGHDMIKMNRTRKKMTSWMIAI